MATACKRVDVAGPAGRIDRANRLDDGRRASGRVLVQMEPEGVAGVGWTGVFESHGYLVIW